MTTGSSSSTLADVPPRRRGAFDFNPQGVSTMFRSLPHSLQRIVRSVRTGRRPTDRRHTYRPRLLVLEDRVALSTLTVTSSADDVTQNHTLRYAVAHAQNGDTIQLTAAVKDPIVLTQGELVLSNDVTITSVPSRTP